MGLQDLTGEAKPALKTENQQDYLDQLPESKQVVELMKLKHIDYVKNKVDNHKKLEGYLSTSSFTGNQCLRKLFYKQFKEYETNEVTDTNKDFILSLGHYIHDYTQEFFDSELTFVEQFMKDDDLKICGSTDGYLPAFNAVFEIKSCNLNGFEYVKSRRTAKKNHIHQSHIYGYMLKKMFNVDVQNIAIIYFNKNQSQFLNKDGLIKRALEESETATGVDLTEIKDKYIDIDSFIRNGDFWDNSVHVYFQKYDERIIALEIAKLDNFWKQVKLKKSGAKYRIPNKISTSYICDSCEYYSTCREKKIK